jgi:methionyl-tRNA formyltransferase
MNIALLGGGIGMNQLAIALERKSHNVHCYFSPRHAWEEINGISMVKLMNDYGIKHSIAETEQDFGEQIRGKSYDLVLGLGPAWLISRATLNYAKKWVNINSIPAPKFLGGAHSTWQILNQNFIGSTVFQEMEYPIDRGRILAKYDFSYKPEHYTPQSRFEENSRQLILIIEEALHNIMNKVSDQGILIDYSDREYWPRLNSEVHGWIDWAWSGNEIVNFVQAFGSPYIGAHSNLLENTVYFKAAEFVENQGMHPFSAGIIIRQNGKDEFVVAVKGGYLRVLTKPVPNLESLFLEGLRFHSPISKLDIARSTNLRSKDM